MKCPCKRLKKDFQCYKVTSGVAVLSCDEICLEKINEKKKVRKNIFEIHLHNLNPLLCINYLNLNRIQEIINGEIGFRVQTV